MTPKQFAPFAALLVSVGLLLSGCPQQKAPATLKDASPAMMDMSGEKVKEITIGEFGKGKDAKKCPVSGDEIKAGEGKEITLSNGKKIMVCCAGCRNAIEKQPGKYAALMY